MDPAENAENVPQKEWQGSLTKEERTFIIRNLSPPFHYPGTAQSQDAVTLEKSMYEKASSKEEYYMLFGQEIQRRDETFRQNTIAKFPKKLEPVKDFLYPISCFTFRAKIKDQIMAALDPRYCTQPSLLDTKLRESLYSQATKYEEAIHQKAKSRGEYFRLLADTIDHIEKILKEKYPEWYEMYRICEAPASFRYSSHPEESPGLWKTVFSIGLCGTITIIYDPTIPSSSYSYFLSPPLCHPSGGGPMFPHSSQESSSGLPDKDELKETVPIPESEIHGNASDAPLKQF